MANSLPSSSLHPSMASSPQVQDDKKPPVPYIPEHIIFSKILPFLSFDELAKLKCVRKSWCSFISSNPMLPLERFRRYHDVSSSAYSGMVFPECYSDGQLLFLPTLRGGPLDVPDFLSVSFSQQPCKELVASTNGLLCLKCSSGNDNDDIYYVCNPLTKEGHIVPLSNPWHDDTLYNVSSIGLVYDPSKSPAQYKLVCPMLHFDLEDDDEEIVLGFEVFSSQTNKWDKSGNYYTHCIERRPLLNRMYESTNSTYAGGVLYWNCSYHLIYFDPEKDYGGTVYFPFPPFEYFMDYYQIGEFKGHVTLSRGSVRGMQLWILHLDVDNRSSSTSYRWELMHQVSFETVIETNRHVFRNAFCLDIPPPKNREEVKIMFKKGLAVIHLPYGGGGRLFMRVSLQGKKNENVLCYDINSGKLNKFCTLSPANDRWIGDALLYRSSMVSLPKLGKA